MSNEVTCINVHVECMEVASKQTFFPSFFRVKIFSKWNYWVVMRIFRGDFS